MKKLMIALAAAATTMFSFGDLPTGTSFEALTEGPVNVGDIAQKDDTGNQDGQYKYWYSTAPETDELGVITNDVADASLNLGRPDMFSNETQSKSLFIDIGQTTPLVRTALPNSSGVQPVTIGSDGIYLDTLVKFTPAEEAFADTSLTGGDKIAIEYVEHGEEALTPAEPETYTNFVIRAGLIGPSELGQTNYYAYVSGDPDFTNFDKDAWHRLTVRTIADVGDGHVGFVIYLDGDMTKTLQYSTGVDAGFGTLNAVASTFYNSEKHALFPSAIESGATGGSTISSVAFSGNGFIDDVSFTATKPTFIQEASIVTVTWDTNKITAVTLNNTDLSAAEWAEGSYDIEPDNGAVTFDVTFATGYELGACTVTPDGKGGWNGSTAFTNLSAGATCNIGAIFPYFQVGDKYYENAADAVAAALVTEGASYGTLKLYADYAGDIELSDEGNIIIDLAGKTITGTEYGINNSAANLIVTNSTVEVGHVAGDGGAVMIGGGTTTIYGGSFDAAIVIDTETPVLTLFGGKFLNCPEEIEDTSFYLKTFVPQGVAVADIGNNYFQVGGGEEPPAPVIPTYELTVPSVTGASAEVTSNDVVVADLTAIPSNTEVVVTWTLESGYKLTAGSLTENITMDDDKTAATPTVVAITYATLTITPVENCTIVVSNATEEVATGASFDVDEAVELTVYRTPADGYELDNCAATETITMNADRTVTAAVKQSGGGSEDWPDNPSTVSGQTAGDAFGVTGDLANADAATLATWAKENSIDYSDRDTAILTDAFLLNCANNQAAIDAAAANFKITTITVVGDTVTVTPAAGADYGNGQVVIEGATSLTSPISWHTKTTGDHFFRATLVVKPVAAP